MFLESSLASITAVEDEDVKCAAEDNVLVVVAVTLFWGSMLHGALKIRKKFVKLQQTLEIIA